MLLVMLLASIFGSKVTLDLRELVLCPHVGIHGIEYRPGYILRLQEVDELGNDCPVMDKWLKLLFGRKMRNFSF